MAHTDLNNLFEEQFVRAGDGWWFRARRNGPAIAVSNTERDLFVTGFTQAQAHIYRTFLHYGLGSLVLLYAAALLWPDTIAARFVTLMWGLGAFWVSLRATHESAALDVPAMALAKRLPVAAAAEPPSRVYEISKDFRLKLWGWPVFCISMWLIYLGSASSQRAEPVLLAAMGSVLLLAWLTIMFRSKLELLKARWTL